MHSVPGSAGLLRIGWSSYSRPLLVGLGAVLQVSGERIRAVEQGLMFDRVIKGQDGKPLRNRMAHDRVPAVSIVVIDDGVLDRARGYPRWT
jgi:hypothetical protein